MSFGLISYRIDADDRIVAVNEAWDEFARANDGEKATSGAVLGRPLWAFIADTTIHDIYRRLVKIARDGRPSRFRYRCDSPAERRVFHMSIVSAEAGQVVFTSQLETSTPRPPIPLLAAGRRRSEILVRICSWCHRVAWPGEPWHTLEDSAERLQLLEPNEMPGTTHGICDDCCAKIFQLIRERP